MSNPALPAAEVSALKAPAGLTYIELRNTIRFLAALDLAAFKTYLGIGGMSSPLLAEDIADSTAVGRALITAADAAAGRTALGATAIGSTIFGAADAAAVRTAIGAGTSSFSGAFSGLSGIPTTLAGYGITDAQALDADLTAIAALTTTSFGRGLLTVADAAAGRTALGVTPVDLTAPGPIGGGTQDTITGSTVAGTSALVATQHGPATPAVRSDITANNWGISFGSDGEVGICGYGIRYFHVSSTSGNAVAAGFMTQSGSFYFNNFSGGSASNPAFTSSQDLGCGMFIATGVTGFSVTGLEVMRLIPAGMIIKSGATLTFGSFTVATLPSASTAGAGASAFASNAGGNGPCLVTSDGTNWKRSDNTATTVS